MRHIVPIFLILPAAVAAQERFEIKLKKTEQGGVKAVTYSEESASVIAVVTADGKDLGKNEELATDSAKYREEILAKEVGKRPTKLRRTYESAAATKEGMTKSFAYSGKAVTIEKMGDGFQFTLADGTALKGEAAGLLGREFAGKTGDADDLQKHLLPKKPVAVGDSWSIAVTEVLKEIGGAEADKVFTIEQATGKGKLVSTSLKGKARYGVLEIDVQVPLKTLPGTKVVCEPGSKFQLTVTIDACIDGTVDAATLKGNLSFSGTTRVKQGATDAITRFEIRSKRVDTNEPAK